MKGIVKFGGLILLAYIGLAVLLKGSRSERAGKWTGGSSSKTARSGACSAPLPDGRVLVTGGEGSFGPLATTEVYDVSGAFWEAAPMRFPHSEHACVALNGGRVLVAGGKISGGAATNVAEIYDPVSNSWLAAGPMTTGRSGAAASLLKSAWVLIAGGQASGRVLNTLELFDPVLNTFTSAPAFLSLSRKDHAAALLADGRVLIVGGSDGIAALDSTDMYDPACEPANGVVSAGPRLLTPRAGLTATTLLDGRVLVAGGSYQSGDLASAELYDPETGRFSATGNLATGRRGHQAFRIPDKNTVLIVGGTAAGKAVFSAEQFIPWEGVFKPTNALLRRPASATPAPRWPPRESS